MLMHREEEKMKKQVLPITVILTGAMLAAGCGTQSTAVSQPAETESSEAAAAETREEEAAETETAAEEAAAEEPAAAEEGTEEEAALEYDDPSSLPVYKYTGTEEYLDVISEYMVTEYVKNFPQEVNVFIPYSIVAEKDE